MLFHGVARTVDVIRQQELLAAEIAASGELVAEGIVLHTFVRTDRGGFFVVAHGEDEESVRAQLNRLPFVRTGVVTIELSEVRES